MEKIEEVVKDMTPKLIGKTWRKYPTDTSKQKATYGLFQCQYCDETFESVTQNIKYGYTRSCGCLQGGIQGHCSHKFYPTWYSMIYRCTNDKSPAYKHYGGRGITVCDEWLDRLVFLKWCDSTYPNIQGLSLDRIDNDKGYSPDNCRWATKQTQTLNQRISSRNTSGNVGVTYNKKEKRWIANLGLDGKLEHIGSFKSKAEAVKARDQYITSWKLPHKLSTYY